MCMLTCCPVLRFRRFFALNFARHPDGSGHPLRPRPRAGGRLRNPNRRRTPTAPTGARRAARARRAAAQSGRVRVNRYRSPISAYYLTLLTYTCVTARGPAARCKAKGRGGSFSPYGSSGTFWDLSDSSD